MDHQYKKLNASDRSIQPSGITDDPLIIWSGDTLMDLRKNEALKMRIETLNGSDFLFIEAGGFQTKKRQHLEMPMVRDEAHVIQCGRDLQS